jgi:hypothetical protein
MTSPLEEFIPHPDARERFAIAVNAPPGLVMAVARTFDLQSVPTVRAIFEARQLFMGGKRPARAPQGLIDGMLDLGWGVLRDEPDHLFVAGAWCQPWLPDVRFHALSAENFRAHDRPGHVKIAWTLEADQAGALTRLATETRAVATDPEARRRFLNYWLWARFGIYPIRWLLLPAVGRRAEAEWRRRREATA